MDEKSRQFERKLKSELLINDTLYRRNLETNLTAEMQVAVKEAEERLKEFITQSNDKLYTRIDPLLSELEDSRLDRELSTEKSSELEKRIEKLEKAVN